MLRSEEAIGLISLFSWSSFFDRQLQISLQVGVAQLCILTFQLFVLKWSTKTMSQQILVRVGSASSRWARWRRHRVSGFSDSNRRWEEPCCSRTRASPSGRSAARRWAASPATHRSSKQLFWRQKTWRNWGRCRDRVSGWPGNLSWSFNVVEFARLEERKNVLDSACFLEG